MASALDMSLEDLIKNNKTGGRGRGGRGRGVRGRGRGGARAKVTETALGVRKTNTKGGRGGAGVRVPKGDVDGVRATYYPTSSFQSSPLHQSRPRSMTA